MHLNQFRKIGLGILFLLFAQNATSASKVITAKKHLGKGMVYSWLEYRETLQTPIAFGLGISASVVDDLPHDRMLEFTLQPPKKYLVAPFQHFTVDWNPHGHDPLTIYGIPHFDFHFYMISNSDRQKITCMDADALICTKAIPATQIPPDYAPTPAGVPLMGWHWVDVTSPEFNGGPFTSTFIYGYYNGSMTFLEPMVSLQYLQSEPQSVYTVKEAANIPVSGWYPSKYRVRFNSALDTYEVLLTNLNFREGVTTTR